MSIKISNVRGVSLAVVEKPQSSGTSTVHVSFPVGSAYEKPEERGISHFIEHAVFLGSRSFPTREKLETRLMEVGGGYNAWTGTTETTYVLSGENSDLKVILDTLLDVTLFPLFRAEDVENERGVVLSELGLDLDDDGNLNVPTDVAFGSLFNGSPIEVPIIGTAATVNSITVEQMAAFHSRHYRLANALITVATGLCEAEVREALSAALHASGANLEKSHSATLPCISIGEVCGKNDVLKLKSSEANFDFDIFLVGERPQTLRQAVARSLMHSLLSDSELSLLFGELRRRGLVYSASTESSPTLGLEVTRISANVPKEKFGELLSALGPQLKKLADGEFSEDLLRLVRKSMIFSHKQRNESANAVAEEFITTTISGGRYYDSSEIIAECVLVTKSDISREAREVFRKGVWATTLKGGSTQSQRAAVRKTVKDLQASEP